ncbi:MULTISPECIES: glycosyltransferase [unclassified Nocardioides]|uniref:glycosyltransferase n=1 Tax=unclassified Nocardioides TaxID=2615069 RepID=UPI00360725EA
MAETEPVERRAARLLRSGILDVEFYSALTGVDFESEHAAAVHAVTEGMSRRLSVSPFLDFVSLPQHLRRAWRSGRVGVVLRELEGDQVGPLAGAADRGEARAAMLRAARAVAGTLTDAPLDRAPVAGRTSVVLTTDEDWFKTARALAAVLDERADADVEVVVVDRGSPPHVGLALAARCATRETVRLLRLDADPGAAAAADAGIAATTGEHVVLLARDSRVRRGWLPALLAPLADPDVVGVQALLLNRDDTIQAAGLVAEPDGPLRPLLAGHPRADAADVAGRGFAAVSADALALRAADLVRGVAGLATRPGGFRVAPDALVTRDEPLSDGVLTSGSPDPASDVYAALGWDVTLDGDGRVAVAGRLRRDPDRLRWGIRIPSTGGHWGDQWGDTHFAEELAGSLRRLGQDAVVHRRDAHDSAATAYDDVSLVIRGRERGRPAPGQTSVVWVISHPDEVTAEELADFDLVFAASVPWAAARSARPLLQATALPEVAGGGDRSPTAVFVGSAEDRTRPMVHWAVEAGVPIEVYGRGWDGLPRDAWRAEHLPNDRLGELYRSHAVVIADHWPDMARQGFVANRVFDAVASGAQVLCDEVAGVAEMFPGRVRVCRSAADLRTAYDAALAAPPPPAAEEELSFDDRARELLRAVRDLRGGE